MMKAVFAGTFDPFTVGHLDIVTRAAPLFDELIVLVACNVLKKHAFAEDLRVRWIEQAIAPLKNVRVDTYSGLTVNYMKQVFANYLVRGIRSEADLSSEMSLSVNNKILYPSAETLLLVSNPKHFAVSSSTVRELLKFGASIEGFVPPCIQKEVEDAWRKTQCLE